MRQHFNYAISQGPGGVDWEADYASCGHCQAQMRVEPPKDGHIISRVLPPCPGCGRFICNVCMQTPGCKTWERKMDEAEAHERMLLRALNG